MSFVSANPLQTALHGASLISARLQQKAQVQWRYFLANLVESLPGEPRNYLLAPKIAAAEVRYQH